MSSGRLYMSDSSIAIIGMAIALCVVIFLAVRNEVVHTKLVSEMQQEIGSKEREANHFKMKHMNSRRLVFAIFDRAREEQVLLKNDMTGGTVWTDKQTRYILTGVRAEK